MTFGQVFDAVTKGYGIRRKEWHPSKIVTMGERYLAVVLDYDSGEKALWTPSLTDLYDKDPLAQNKLRDDWEIVVVEND
jgi:hypothetical protein